MKKILLILLYMLPITVVMAQYNKFDGSGFIVEESKTPRLLILTTENNMEAAQLLANWKNSIGVETDILLYNSNDYKHITHDSVPIQESLKYDAWWTKVDNAKADYESTYILIIGKGQEVPSRLMSDIPSFEYSGDIRPSDIQKEYYTDFFYGCDALKVTNGLKVTGVGRLPFSYGYATAMVKSIIEYESNPPTDQSYYDRIVSLANYQDRNKDMREDQGFIYTQYNITYKLESQFGKTALRFYNYDIGTTVSRFSDTYGNDGYLSADLLKTMRRGNIPSLEIANAINDGSMLVMYSGHGSKDGWLNPSFSSSDTGKLGLYAKAKPVVMAMACSTIDYKDDNSFAIVLSGLLDGPNIDEHAGCLAYFGANNVALSGFVDWQLYGMMSAIWPDADWNFYYDHYRRITTGQTFKNPVNSYRLGSILNAGRKRMFDYYYPNMLKDCYDTYKFEDEYSNLIYNAEIIGLIGDPSMVLYADRPTKFSEPSISSELVNGKLKVSAEFDNDVERFTIFSMEDGITQIIKNRSVSDNSEYEEINVDTWEKDYFEYSITGKGKIPYFGKIYLPREDVYLQNEVITGKTNIKGKGVILGSNVTQNKPSGKVVVTDAELDVECEELIIMPGTEIDENSVLNIQFTK